MIVKQKLLFLFLSLIFSISILNSSDTHFSQIITKDDIESSGIVRISEILLLIDDARIISHEGFTWKASISGLSSYQNQSWLIKIDDILYNRNIFDVNNLNMLPITIRDILYVEIYNVPSLSNSDFVENGLIHFHTDRSIEDKNKYTGYAVIGSETRDGGPYNTVINHSSPNVDKTGPVLSIRSKINVKDFQIIASFIGHSHCFSDSKLRKRNEYSITDGETWAGIKRISPLLTIVKKSESSKHELSASFSYSDKYPFYLESLGREIPTYCTFSNIGYKNEANIGSTRKIISSIQYSFDQLKKYPNIYNFDFDWNMHVITSTFEIEQQSIIDRIGITAEYDKLDTDYQLEKDKYFLFKLYCSSKYIVSDKLEFDTNFMIVTDKKKYAPKASFSQIYSINNNKILSLISYASNLSEENPNLLYWTQNGYDLLEKYGFDYTFDNIIRSESKLTYDLVFKSDHNKYLDVILSGKFRSFKNLTFEEQSFIFNNETYSFDSQTDVISGIDGNVIGISLRLKQSFNNSFNHKFFVSHQKAIKNDDLFVSNWQKIPENKFSYQCDLTLFSDLKIGFLFNYFSKTNWNDYALIEDESYYIGSQEISYTSTLKEIRTANIKIQKKFLNKKMTGSLILQNLFNENYFYHPIGASFDLAYFIQISFEI